MITVTLEGERQIVEPYVQHLAKLQKDCNDTLRILDGMLTLIYPQWDPRICMYKDGIITDPRDEE